jgi:ParB family chromosome partitioning protein
MANVKSKEIDVSHYRHAIPTPSNNLRKGTGAEKQVGEYYFLKIDSLLPYKNQARKIFNDEEIKELSETIKEHGIRQPLSVISSDTQKERFEVISGERRLRAAKLAGLEVVPCIIVKDATRVEEVALIENVHRSDLHIVEFADAVAALAKNQKWGDVSEIAKKIGKPLSEVSRALAISKFPQEVKSYLLSKGIGSRDVVRKLIGMEYSDMKKFLGFDKSVQIPHPVD